MSDVQQQPTESPEQQTAQPRQRPAQNDQALPSIETWDAPWADDLNEIRPVDRPERAHVEQGPKGPTPVGGEQPA